jgi:hypothetical protein
MIREVRLATNNLLFPPALTRETAALRLLLIVLTAFCVGSFVRLGSIGFISDSEIWAVTLATHFAEEWRHPWVSARPLFYGMLAPLLATGTDSISIFSIAKAVFIANGLLILFLLYRVARSLADAAASTASLIPWLAVLVLVTNTGFLNQGYRIRSDLLACSFVLLALERTIRIERQGGPRSTRERFLSALLWLLPLGATPKAILQIIPAFSFASSLNPFRGSSGKTRLIGGGAVALALLAAIPIYSGSLSYFLASFSGEGSTPFNSIYLRSAGFIFLMRIVSKNWIFSGVLLVRSIFLGIRLRTNAFRDPVERRIQARFFVFCALDVAMALLAPERYPFFLAALLAPLAVFAALLVEDAWILHGRMARPFGVVLAFIALTLAVTAKSEYETDSLADSDRDEMTMIRYLESYVSAYPKAVFYDVIGILPRQATLRYFAGPNDSVANDSAIAILEKNPPDLIFYTNKSLFLEPRLGMLLKKSYSNLTQGAYGLWQDVKPLLPLSPRSLPQLRREIDRVATSVGAPHVGKIRLELILKDGGRSVVDLSLKDLDAFRLKGAQVARFSPFTELENPPPLQIRETFRFDSEY